MNWATERAREVVNSVGFRENPEAAIAAALQAVADECEAIAKRYAKWTIAQQLIRARFTKEKQ